MSEQCTGVVTLAGVGPGRVAGALVFFFFQAEDGIRDLTVTGVQTCALPILYTYGIVVLAALTCLLLVLFGGVTDKLIPLYAVGAFLAFTLSQFGMVVHWQKKRGPHWRKSALVNGLGGMVTGVTAIVVLVPKFAEGAWITVLFIPLLIFLFRLVRRHYHMISVATRCIVPVVPASHNAPPIAVVPVDHWNSICKQAIEFASRLSPEIIA